VGQYGLFLPDYEVLSDHLPEQFLSSNCTNSGHPVEKMNKYTGACGATQIAVAVSKPVQGGLVDFVTVWHG
jgi:hypothetical protein